MLVKLTQNILEGNGVKISIRKPPRKCVAFVEAAVVEVSDATGAKWIDQAKAVAYTPADGEQAA